MSPLADGRPLVFRTQIETRGHMYIRYGVGTIVAMALHAAAIA